MHHSEQSLFRSDGTFVRARACQKRADPKQQLAAVALKRGSATRIFGTSRLLFPLSEGETDPKWRAVQRHKQHSTCYDRVTERGFIVGLQRAYEDM
jgi:hypothetical protein